MPKRAIENAETVFVSGSADESLQLRRLIKHSSTDYARTVIQALRVDPDVTWATDGFRAVAIPTPECLKHHEPANLVFHNLRAGKFSTEAEVRAGTFPVMKEIIPTTEVTGEIAINARFLRDLAELAGDQTLILQIRDHNTPMVVRSYSEPAKKQKPLFAVIMPVYIPTSRQDTLHDELYDPFPATPEPEPDAVEGETTDED